MGVKSGGRGGELQVSKERGISIRAGDEKRNGGADTPLRTMISDTS